MIVKLLTEHHLECLSLKGGCRGSSESTHVKMPHCWKSHVLAHISVRITNIWTGQDLYCNKVHAGQVYTIQMYPTGKSLNKYLDRKTNTIQCRKICRGRRRRGRRGVLVRFF